MECSINIGSFAVQSLSNNANINSGPTYQNSHTANSTLIGGIFSYGDYCTTNATNIISSKNQTNNNPNSS